MSKPFQTPLDHPWIDDPDIIPALRDSMRVCMVSVAEMLDSANPDPTPALKGIDSTAFRRIIIDYVAFTSGKCQLLA